MSSNRVKSPLLWNSYKCDQGDMFRWWYYMQDHETAFSYVHYNNGHLQSDLAQFNLKLIRGWVHLPNGNWQVLMASNGYNLQSFVYKLNSFPILIILSFATTTTWALYWPPKQYELLGLIGSVVVWSLIKEIQRHYFPQIFKLEYLKRNPEPLLWI